MKSFKQQCIELRKKDYTVGEIMKMTGRGKSTVYYHIKDIPLSEKKKKEISENTKQLAIRVAAKRKGVALRPYKPFDTLTPELVLLISHLMFDGELKKSSVYNNRSVALIARVKNLMKLVYDFEPHLHTDKQTGVRRISYHNVALSAFLKEKAQEIKDNITQLPINHQKEFIRAFFDDEGCMDVRLNRNHRRIRGYQNDQEILRLIQRLLQNLNIESSLRGRNEVVIVGKENLIKFQKEINFSKGVRLNPNRTNSLWKKNLEKRVLLDMAIKSFKT